MSAQFPNGTIFSVSTARGAAIALTGLTNAAPPVASALTQPPDGTILLLNSGWVDVNERIVRSMDADPVDGTFVLDGINTANPARFPAGLGVGTVAPVQSWVQLSQVRDIAKAGGEQQFFTWQYVEDRTGRQRQRPTFKTAKSITLTLDYDPALAWYASLAEADAEKDPVVLQAVLPNSAQLYYYVYPSFDADPSMAMNENMTNTATFSLISDMTRFEAAQ